MTSILEPFASKHNPNETGTVSVYASVNQDSGINTGDYPSIQYLKDNYYDKDEIDAQESGLQSSLNSKVDKSDISSTLNTSATSDQSNAYSQYYINNMRSTLNNNILQLSNNLNATNLVVDSNSTAIDTLNTNMADKVDKSAIVQTLGTSTTDIMSQNATRTQLVNKLSITDISSTYNSVATSTQKNTYNQYYINQLQTNLAHFPIYTLSYTEAQLKTMLLAGSTLTIGLNATASTTTYTHQWLQMGINGNYLLFSLPTYDITDTITGLSYNNCGIEGTLYFNLGSGSLDYDIKVVLYVLIATSDLSEINPTYLNSYLVYQLIFPVTHRMVDLPSNIAGTRAGWCDIHFLNQVITNTSTKYYKFLLGLLYKPIPPSEGSLSNSSLYVNPTYSRITTFVKN